MNTFDIIAIVAIAVLALLFWNSRSKAKKLEAKIKLENDVFKAAASDIKRLESIEKENERLAEIIDRERQLLKERDLSIQSGNENYDKLYSEYEAAKTELAELREANAKQPDGTVGNNMNSVHDILLSFGDTGFKNTATIHQTHIILKAEDLIDKNKLKVLKSLYEAGLFPEYLESDLNLNPKTLQVDFQMVRYDEEGDAIGFRTWLDFLNIRQAFIAEVHSYVDGVVHQKRVSDAVSAALNGKEAQSA